MECGCCGFAHFVGDFFGFVFQHEWHETMDNVRPLDCLLDDSFLAFGELEAVFLDQSLKEGDFQLGHAVNVLVAFVAGGQNPYLVTAFAKFVRKPLRRNAGAVVVREVGVDDK